MTTILIADDHPLFRAALVRAIEQCLSAACILEARDFPETRALLEQHPETDLVLLDLHMPGSRGLAAIAELRCHHPAVAVVVVSANDDARVIRRALDHGAAGYIPKRSTLDELDHALATVLDCREWVPPELQQAVSDLVDDDEDRDLAARIARLTPQQFRVLAMVADGALNKQIADALNIQERTVKAHMSEIFQKLEVRNRTQAGVAFRRLELVDPTRRIGD
ncbi:MAG: response regulator transcription factor [Wenzhouxiangellaceae bacterium]